MVELGRTYGDHGTASPAAVILKDLIYDISEDVNNFVFIIKLSKRAIEMRYLIYLQRTSCGT